MILTIQPPRAGVIGLCYHIWLYCYFWIYCFYFKMFNIINCDILYHQQPHTAHVYHVFFYCIECLYQAVVLQTMQACVVQLSLPIVFINSYPSHYLSAIPHELLSLSASIWFLLPIILTLVVTSVWHNGLLFFQILFLGRELRLNKDNYIFCDWKGIF